jgi:hypothetical protein
MRFIHAVALAGFAVTPLAAQATVQLTAGATYSTPLVDDGILDTKLRPATAPTVGLAVAIPTGTGPYRALLEGHYSRSRLKVTEGSGATDQLSSVGVLDALLMLEAPIRGGIRARIGGGAIFYQPSERQGVFLNGAAHRWIIAGELFGTRRLTDRMNLLLTGRIDYHEFNTSLLRARGYGGNQSVQRYALSIGVERKL